MAPVAQRRTTAPARAAWIAAAAHDEPARSRRHHPCPAPSQRFQQHPKLVVLDPLQTASSASRKARPRLCGAHHQGHGTPAVRRHRRAAASQPGSSSRWQDLGLRRPWCPPSARQPTRSGPACRTPVLPHCASPHGEPGVAEPGTAAAAAETVQADLAARVAAGWSPTVLPTVVVRGGWPASCTTAEPGRSPLRLRIGGRAMRGPVTSMIRTWSPSWGAAGCGSSPGTLVIGRPRVVARPHARSSGQSPSFPPSSPTASTGCPRRSACTRPPDHPCPSACATSTTWRRTPAARLSDRQPRQRLVPGVRAPRSAPDDQHRGGPYLYWGHSRQELTSWAAAAGVQPSEQVIG
jgi:hypothetical protein